MNRGGSFGTHCAECKKKLGEYRLDGIVNEKKVGFCSFGYCDTYRDREEASEKT